MSICQSCENGEHFYCGIWCECDCGLEADLDFEESESVLDDFENFELGGEG